MTVTTRRGTTVGVEASADGGQATAKKKGWADSHGTGDRSGAWGLGGTLGTLVSYAGTLVLLVGCPAFAIYMWYTLTQLDGSVTALVQFAQKAGLQGVFMPGQQYKGPVTPKGNVPVYKANGVQCFLATHALFFLSWRLGYFDPARVYDLFGEMLAALNIVSLLFCLFLYIKGNVAPSSTDSGSTGSLIFDYYWGMELYPRLGKHFDLKTWTNCRMGMMGWSVLILCYAAKQRELYGHVADSMIVSVLLMEVYIFKFFIWETGYWGSMDIMHDRAGYYICWGCLVWVPSIYTSPALFLTTHPVQLGTPLAAAIALAGIACIYINYDSDRQRQVFRATEGRSYVWGKPPRKIKAQYETADGKTKTSLLLASGWWGLARHFHYLPEILAAFFWTAPALLSHPLPYFYVFFLTLLLTDRAFRDDVRCGAKYGEYWQQYRKLVPAKMIPFIF
ncbi:hypothetical protein WJX72_010602 [[Myrmecia] bisecta]|uniref:7-dehydrocholesterol reductase n=1 Tax=[Myrmecia] bisecta TaxID=41462 RepID=A0AAW1PH74_9CHLO